MFDTTSDAYRKVEAELLPGEELLWIGQPSSGLAAMRGYPLARLATVFGLVVAFALFGLMMLPTVRFGMGAMTSMNAIGPLMLPVIIMGVVLLGMIGSAVAAYMRAQNAIYAITDRRIIMLGGLLSTSVTSYGPQDVERVERRMRGGGSGDLIFRYEQRARSYRSNQGFGRTRYESVPVGFFGIPNVREVEALLLETFRPDDDASWRDADIEARTAQALWSETAKPKRHSLQGDALEEDDLIDLDALNADSDLAADRLGERKPKRS
jgi:hypothetical protein